MYVFEFAKGPSNATVVERRSTLGNPATASFERRKSLLANDDNTAAISTTPKSTVLLPVSRNDLGHTFSAGRGTPLAADGSQRNVRLSDCESEFNYDSETSCSSDGDGDGDERTISAAASLSAKKKKNRSGKKSTVSLASLKKTAAKMERQKTSSQPSMASNLQVAGGKSQLLGGGGRSRTSTGGSILCLSLATPRRRGRRG